MKYDLIVVGGGHAGCEASLAAARLGVKTLLLTISPDTIAAMSCNPAIGGPAAKSHLVREIDALGGEMGKVIDQSYLNIRRINESRGPAVLALRAQADKRLYQAEMTLRLEQQPNLSVKQGLVTDLLVEQNHIRGIRLKSGREYFAQAVILATGTFLGGKIVMGNIHYIGGRQGEPAALELSASLKEHGIVLRRFQTATPPRLHRRSIDFGKIKPQPLQEPEWGFSWDGLNGVRSQTPCWVTNTTKETIKTIQNNLKYSPIFSGSITSHGPHFCPSIDRKVINFPSKTDHLIFLEPEGVYTEEIYLLGLTTAMPEVVQEEILRTIPGLENSEIIRPGYAVEYDCLDSFQIKPSLESKIINNLFTAGQINGTSGYEEAAAQGVIAGINAARKIRGRPAYVPIRSDSYLGVLIDDLVTQKIDEPYRMLTSSAEFRLFLRLDNALHRLGHKGYEIGLNGEERWSKLRRLIDGTYELQRLLRETKIKPDSDLWRKLGLSVPDRGYNLLQLVSRPEVSDENICGSFSEIKQFPAPVREYVWNEIKLAGYLGRQSSHIAEFHALEEKRLPWDISYEKITGISSSGLAELQRIQPVSIGQAFRIKEFSSADRTALLLWYHQHEHKWSMDA